MSLNRHSISAVATAKKLKTPLKASVVILTTVILASCASDGGDSITPKPSPTIPKDDSGTAGGSETEGSGVDTGSNAQAEAAIKAAEAKTKAAEDALKQAKAKTKAAEDALKAAEMKFGVESQKAAEASQKAIDAARSEAAKAKVAAEAARVEAVAKIESAAQEAEGKIKAAKEAAAKEAVAKVKVAEANAKAAEARANTAEAKAKELQDLLASEKAAKEAAEAKAKLEAKKAAEAAKKQAAALAAANSAKEAKEKAETTLAAAEKAKAEAIKAQQAAEKALEDVLANGGGSDALQKEAERKAKLAQQAQAQAESAQADAQVAKQAAEAQTALALAAKKAAEDALAAANINHAPEATKSGVQSLNINAGTLGLFNTTTRDFAVNEDGSAVDARADIASQKEDGTAGLLPLVPVTISGEGDTEVANGFKSHKDKTDIVVAAIGQTLPLTYNSTYKDFGDDMRIGHIDGSAEVALLNKTLPVNGVAVIGNATQAANMPTEGKVGYTGDATYRNLGIGNDIEFGKSVFTADFVAKNVKGDLTFDNAGKIGLTADINGNQFSGTAADNAGYNTEGGFFGGDAQYLGGVYQGNGAQGTYGAKSDQQTAAEQAAVKAQAEAAKANADKDSANAQAAAAKAAADKAQADAVKAQEALAKAEEALANAGTGDGGLAAALARAEAAEKAEAAALAAAATAETARLAAEQAQAAAEDAALKAKAAADKAVGDAKAEADKKVAEANQQVADAKAQAAEAKKRAEEAEQAKLDAEARAKAAEDALEAAQQLPPAPTNPKAPVNATITGFQNSIADHDNSGISANTSASYDTYTALLNETGSRDFKNSINVELRNASDEDYEGSFKKSELKQIGGAFKNKLNYTSTYKNFDDQMQIGHVYGDLKGPANLIQLSKLSNVYVQGNSTNIDDMQYMKTLSQYNIDNKINDGKVNYKGVASYIGNSKEEIIGHDPIIGTSDFKVDFVDSQLDGTLSFDGSNVSQKKIKAEISGNTFAGSWNGVDTKGGFYGEDAKLLGGVYQVADGKGTYGATKAGSSSEPTPTPKAITGVMSNTVSSVAGTGTENAIGYRQFVRDNDTFNTTTGSGEDTNPVMIVDTNTDNLPGYNQLVGRLDITKPGKFGQASKLTLVKSDDISLDDGFKKSKETSTATFGKVESILGKIDLKYDYQSVYKNFDSQMQIGHVYGDMRKEGSFGGVKSRYTNVYVMGEATENMPTEGKVQYAGVATYMDNLHLGSGALKTPVVNGTSDFNVDFVNDSLTGTLKFADINKNIGISADINGNTFAGSKDNIATSGGFYGEDAKFLGGIYQEAQPGSVPGTGTTPGTGTNFQGTFGAEKQ